MTEFDLPAANYMVTPVHTVRDTTRLAAAAEALDDLGLSALPVVDGARRLTGLLDRLDLIRVGRLRGSRTAPRWWLPDITVAECMQSAVPVVNRSTPLRDCARRMLERGDRRLFVVVDRELEGVISTSDIVRAVAGTTLGMPIGEMSNDIAPSIAAAAPLALAIEQLSASSGRPLVVLEGSSPIGIFSRSELAICLEANADDATRLWLDEHVVTLPASTPAHIAAQQTVSAHARYLIASQGARGYSVISSLAFASIVGDLPPTAAEERAGEAPRLAIPVAVPEYPSDSTRDARAGTSRDLPLPGDQEKSDALRARSGAVQLGPAPAAEAGPERPPRRAKPEKAPSRGGS